MNKIMRYGALSFVVGSFALAQSASAAGLLGQVDLKANAKASLDARVVQATSSLDADVEAGADADESAGTSSTGAAATGTGAAATATGTAEAELETFVITRDDIAEAEGQMGATLTDPMEVTTEGDLEAYSRSVMLSDENVERIESDGDKVSVWYRQPAQLFGVFSVTVPAQATVYADGRVEVEYPWWADVFASTGDPADIETDLGATAGTIARSMGTTTLSTNTQARLVNALRAVLETQYMESLQGTSTSTGTDAEAEVRSEVEGGIGY